jgi:hypothetical protein
MTYFTYHLEPILAPNNKQHILSSDKLREVCYSLAGLYIKPVYLNLIGWRGALSQWNILRGGANYKSLGTSAPEYQQRIDFMFTHKNLAKV